MGQVCYYQPSIFDEMRVLSSPDCTAIKYYIVGTQACVYPQVNSLLSKLQEEDICLSRIWQDIFVEITNDK